MNGENRNDNSKDLQELQTKYIAALEVNKEQSRLILELRRENTELRNNMVERAPKDAREGPGSEPRTEQVQSLIDINHAWKKDYELLQEKYNSILEMKKELEGKVSNLEEYVVELNNRQKPLENEVARLAAILYAQNAIAPCNDDTNAAKSPDKTEQCDLLRTQMLVYKEDFERERLDRTRTQNDREKLRRKLNNAEEIIKKLTEEVDRCKENERFISERLQGRCDIASAPYQSLQLEEERRRYEQNRRGILPRNPPPNSFYYGGDLEVDTCCS